MCATRIRRSRPTAHQIIPRKGHESITSTQAYLHADMKQKEQAIARTAPPGVKQVRYKPPDPLLAFLENL